MLTINDIVTLDEEFDTAFLGTTIDGVYVYDAELIVEVLKTKHDYTPEEADNFVFALARTNVDGSPVIVFN